MAAVPFDSIWLLLLIIVCQFILNLTVQRQAYGHLKRKGGRLLAHVLGGWGTVLHELAHATMVKLMGANVVVMVLYNPKRCREEFGKDALGFVRWRFKTKNPRFPELRQALFSAAPGILIPPLLALTTWAMLGTLELWRYEEIAASRPSWLIVAWLVIIFLAGRSMFPSPGDHFNRKGLLWLFTIFVLPLLMLLVLSPVSGAQVLQWIAIMLLPSTLSSALWVALVMRD